MSGWCMGYRGTSPMAADSEVLPSSPVVSILSQTSAVVVVFDVVMLLIDHVVVSFTIVFPTS